jgi:hypothetical protein
MFKFESHRVDTVLPNYVVSSMSKFSKPSLLVPTAKAFGKAVLHKVSFYIPTSSYLHAI